MFLISPIQIGYLLSRTHVCNAAIFAEGLVAAGHEQNVHMKKSDRQGSGVQQVQPENIVEVSCSKNFGTLRATIENVFEYTAEKTSPI
jgi:hypothetical protein